MSRPPAIGRMVRALGIGLFILLFAAPVSAGPLPILIVMSYSVENEWCKAIRSGIEQQMGAEYDLHYAYLDTRSHPEEGPRRAAEAFTTYEALKPRGVIAVDDNAQSYFVVPYLRNKVDTPVIFCGVNAAPEVYEYPAKNVTGILERYHIKETIALLQQLVPGAERVAFIGLDAPTGRLMLGQAEEEVPNLPLKQTQFLTVKTIEELTQQLTDLRTQVDALYLSILRGLVDAEGTRLSDAEIVRSVTQTFAKPVVSAAFYDLPHGVLCSVIHTGEEQGRMAAAYMDKAVSGAPVAGLPIVRNYNGQRVINVSAMRKLGIKPRPILLRGAKLIRSEQ